MSIECLHGGPCNIPPILSQFMRDHTKSPDDLFNSALITLGITIFTMRAMRYILSFSPSTKRSRKRKDTDEAGAGAGATAATSKPTSVKSLQLRFLPVFWLLRLAFWMSGPYFYQVYASKSFHGEAATPTIVNQIFLVGFASIAIFGPTMGRALDTYGRKKGTIAACMVYTFGALSTASSSLPVLFAGRAIGGLGTYLLSSAPESWMVSESLSSGDATAGTYLSETFGLAYSYDPVVAILSGQIAGWAAKRNGPTGPFMQLPAFLFGGCLIAVVFWGENKAPTTSSKDEESYEPTATVRDGAREIWKDKKLLLLGAVQSLFEGSMYIFVSQWPPAMTAAVKQVYGNEASVPFGTVFSCFMACCMIGSTIFSKFSSSGIFLERHGTKMLLIAALSMAMTTHFVLTSMDITGLILGFFAFEACVGMYFPMIGTMRSKYLPDSHRSVVMSLYAIPLNVLVVTVFLFIGRLGTVGAFAVATAALTAAVICMILLRRRRSQEARRNLKRLSSAFWKTYYAKVFSNEAQPRTRMTNSSMLEAAKSMRMSVAY